MNDTTKSQSKAPIPWWQNIKCKCPITQAFFQSIDHNDMESIESNVRFLLSSTYKPIRSKTAAINNITHLLAGTFLIDADSLFYNDSDEGEVRVIRNFTARFNNSILDLVNTRQIAELIVEKIYKNGKKDYRHDTYTL